MGQYFIIVNKSKREYLDPDVFDEGSKLAEFGSDSNGVMKALAFLLADNTDIPWQHKLLGKWSGDNIVIAGDYGPKDEYGVNLYAIAIESYKDISKECIDICDL